MNKLINQAAWHNNTQMVLVYFIDSTKNKSLTDMKQNVTTNNVIPYKLQDRLDVMMQISGLCHVFNMYFF